MSYMFILVVIVGVTILAVVLVLGLSKRYNEKKIAVEKEGKLNWLNVARNLWGAFGLVCILPTLCLILFIDSPPSSESWLIIWSIISFPIICIGSSLGIWVLKDKYKKLAFYVSLLPALPLILIFAFYTWSYISCGSQSNCQSVSTMQEQGNAIYAAECALPVLDGGDSLETTGCGVLKVGVSATGTINSTSEAHNWQFSVQNSNRITITIEHHGNSCSQISILDSNGSVIQSFKDENKTNICSSGMPSSMTTASFYYFDPPNQGTYILRITAPQVPSDYWLKIE